MHPQPKDTSLQDVTAPSSSTPKAPIRGWWTSLADTQQLAVILWSIAMAVCVGRMLIRPAHSVYPNFAEAASRWVQGKPIYVTTREFDYRYSPAVAVGFVPLLLLGQRIGGAIWVALNGAALLAAMSAWLKRGTPRLLPPRQRGAVFLLLLPLAIGNIASGQSNALVIAVILAAAVAVDASFWSLAALLTTVAFLCKLYPLAFGLLLVLIHPRKMGWRLTLAVAAALLIPYLFQHTAYVTHQYQDWLRYLGEEDRGAVDAARAYRDLQFLLHDLRLPITLRAYRFVEMIAGMCIGIVCLLAQKQKWPRSSILFLLVTLAVCWMTLFGPATESMTYVLAAPVICWLVVARRDEGRSWIAWLYIAVYLMMLYPPFAGLFPGHSVMRSPHLKSIQPVAVLFMLSGVLTETVQMLRGTISRVPSPQFM